MTIKHRIDHNRVVGTYFDIPQKLYNWVLAYQKKKNAFRSPAVKKKLFIMDSFCKD